MSECRVFAVILAAGASSRMGQSKMALEWGETTVLETTLTNIEHSQACGVLLITGGYREVVEALPKVATTAKIHNLNYEAGEMISSIKLALQVLQQSEQKPAGVLVLPGDMPLVSTEIIDQVIAHWIKNPDKIIAPVFGKQRGHPVIFPFTIFSMFDTLLADSSPRELIKVHSKLLELLPIEDPAIIIDIDTPAEYAKFRPGPTR